MVADRVVTAGRRELDHERVMYPHRQLLRGRNESDRTLGRPTLVAEVNTRLRPRTTSGRPHCSRRSLDDVRGVRGLRRTRGAGTLLLMANRAWTRLILAVAAIGIVSLGVVIVVGAPASTRTCARSPDYGTQCETLSGRGLTVTGIKAQFTTAPDFFTQLVSTFEATTYRCDPRGRSKTECPPEQRTYGTLHRKNVRNTADTICSDAAAHAGGNRCSGSLLFSVPRTFSGARWLCVEIAVRLNGRWVDNAAGLPQGDRACRHVH